MNSQIKYLQKTAEKILKAQKLAEVQNATRLPSRFSDKSSHEDESVTNVRRSGGAKKNQVPKGFGYPNTLSIKEIVTDADIMDLNKAALEAYRIKLARFEKITDKPIETRFTFWHDICSVENLISIYSTLRNHGTQLEKCH